MHRGERVCRSVLFWQKTVRRGSRSGTPRPVAVRHGTDAGKGEGVGREERSGTKGAARKERRGGLARCREEGRERSGQRKGAGWRRTGRARGAPGWTGAAQGREAERGAPPHCGPARHRRPPAKRRRPPITSQTLHRRPIIGPTFPQPPRRPNPHRQPPPAPHHWRQPNAPPAARHPLGGSSAIKHPPAAKPPPAATYHRPTLGSRPSPTQRPLCHSLSPSPRQPSGASPNGRQKRSPSAGRGLNHLSMTNPQRGYLFSFRMRIACSRIVVSSNVTMPPSGPGSK